MARPASPRAQLQLLTEVTDGVSPRESVRDPWDKQPNENIKRYKLFLLYRDMGPTRSITRLAEFFNGETRGPQRSYLSRVAGIFRWHARATAWDEWLDLQFVTKLTAERKDAVQRHIDISSMYLEKVTQRMSSLNPEALSPGQLVMWLDIAVKVQRLSYGLSTESYAKESVVVNNNTATYNTQIVTDKAMQEKIEKYTTVFRTLEETQRADDADSDTGLSRSRLSLPAGS